MKFDIDLFKLNPKPMISYYPVTECHIPILVVDNFYQYPHKVREFALALEFEEKGLSDHPGLLATSKHDGRNISRFLYQHYGKKFKMDEQVWHAKFLDHQAFRLLKARKESLNPRQCIPHADGRLFAGIVYLNTPIQCMGGTGFYQHKKTKI